MSIRSPDINADYLQIRDIEIVRGDTFGLAVRLLVNGQPNILTDVGVVTFALYTVGRAPALTKKYTAENAEQDDQGYINMYLTPEETAMLNASARYTYEVEWTINRDTVYTILQGTVKIIPDKIRGAE